MECQLQILRIYNNSIRSTFLQQQSGSSALCQQHTAAGVGRRGFGARVLGDELDAEGGADLGGAGQVPAVFAPVLLEHPGYD